VAVLSLSCFIYYFSGMKRLRITCCILFVLAAGYGHAQSAAPGADTLSSFPGGDRAFDQFITEHLQITPQALAAHVNGDVELSFVIDEKGYAGDFKPIKRLGYGCEEQVIRVLRTMPRWQPGVIAGRRIKTTLQRSFHFSANLKVSDSTTEVTRTMVPNAPEQFGQKEGDLATYITQHFTWPANAPKDISGAIVLQFKIDETGSATDVQIVTGILPELDEAAVHLVKNMPPWAAKQVDFKSTIAYKELTIGFKKKKALLY
jgi:TonB family protein